MTGDTKKSKRFRVAFNQPYESFKKGSVTEVVDSDKIRQLDDEGILTILEEEHTDHDDVNGVRVMCMKCGKEIVIPHNEWPPEKCPPLSEGGCDRVTAWEYTSDQQREKHLGKYFRPEDKHGRFLPRRFVMDIIKTDTFITFKDVSKNSIYVYDDTDGIYHDAADCYIEKRVQDILGDETTTRRVKEVVNGVMRETYVERDIVCDDPQYIPLENGVYDLKIDELKPHDPGRVFLSSIPVCYDADADCPQIKQFLSEVLHERDIPVMQELCGYILYTASPYDVITLLVGGGANGKTTWLNVLKHFYGQANLSHVPMRDLSRNRFASGQLYGKLANISNEIAKTKQGTLANTGTLKNIAGGDTIWTDVKWSKKGRIFAPYAKMVFALNEAPAVTEDTLAWWRRLMILPFPNTFKGDDALNRNILVQELTTERELSGFFNWCIEGLHRLLENDGFSYNITIDEVREQYQRISDSIAAFVTSECTLDVRAPVIPRDDLYRAYLQWCQREDIASLDKSVFNRQLPQKCDGRVKKCRPTIAGRRVRCWEGIMLTDVSTYDGLRISQKQNEGAQEDLDEY
ncbi:MAG: DNA primase family protein [Thermoplasmatota archaeon]